MMNPEITGNNTKFILFQREVIFPKWLVVNPIAFLFIAMILCWIVFGHIPHLDLALVAILSVCVFFYSSRTMSVKLSYLGEKQFLQSIFKTGFIIRIVWVLYMFLIFNPKYYGNTYGSIADVDWFMSFGRDLSAWLSNRSDFSLAQVINMNMAAIDDVAYPMILGVEYLLTGGMSDVFIPMVVKSVMGAYCAVSVYRITMRHFGVGAARLAAIFVCLNINLIYWSANMMKEAEMVFFCCLAVDKFDEALSSNSQLTIKSLLPGILSGFVLLFMRTTLGLALFMAVLVHVLLADRKIISIGKKIFVGAVVAFVLFLVVGDRLMEQSRGYIDIVQSGGQEQNMAWRSERDGGNSFAKYAGAAVFAPLIFTLPFPTLNMANVDQILQPLLSGGYYIKNLFSFFVILMLIQFLITGEWRKHVFILGYTCAYLVVLVFSGYAQSGRFHMPIWPMLMIFAAYGIQMAKTDKRLRTWFTYVLFAEVFICLAWNWFKLAGRGMI